MLTLPAAVQSSCCDMSVSGASVGTSFKQRPGRMSACPAVRWILVVDLVQDHAGGGWRDGVPPGGKQGERPAVVRVREGRRGREGSQGGRAAVLQVRALTLQRAGCCLAADWCPPSWRASLVRKVHVTVASRHGRCRCIAMSEASVGLHADAACMAVLALCHWGHGAEHAVWCAA